MARGELLFFYAKQTPMRAKTEKRKFMEQLARRVHERRDEFERRHPGRRIPINDTLSRILEHDPTYKPMRRRSPDSVRAPLLDPRISTLRLIASDLGTTVADLIGEVSPQAMRAVDMMTAAQRRTLRDAVAILLLLLDHGESRDGRGKRVDSPA